MPTVSLSKLCFSDSDKTENCKQLYFASFPKDERRLWEDIYRLQTDNTCFNFFSVTFNGEFAGIASVWVFEKMVYIEHFAISKAKRCHGIGSKVLEELKALYQKPIVLEIDVPNDCISERRAEFYRRNGFFMHNYFYLQPPYKKGLNSVEMKIMSDSDALTFDYIRSVLYSKVYGVQ
ncbi:MAG: GNAT family N-acetyltransferase [Bacteroidales bacterium]|nr:GNAT family N-acetyltransferase [Bacteroidales bacterium]